jgi:hypothetical protein
MKDPLVRMVMLGVVLLALMLLAPTLLPDTPAQAQDGQNTIQCNSTGAGEFFEDSPWVAWHDWTFESRPGYTVTVTVTRKSGNYIPYVYLDHAGERLAVAGSSDSIDNSAGFIITLPYEDVQTQNYTITVSENDTYGKYEIELMCIAPDPDMPSDTSQGSGGEIYCGQYITGKLDDATPAQLWEYNGSPNETITVEMTSTSGNLDPFLRILKPDGNPLIEDDDGAGFPNAKLTATLPDYGTYIIQAQRVGDEDGNYQLALGCRSNQGDPIVDQPPPPAQIEPIVCNSTINGYYETTSSNNTRSYSLDGTPGSYVIVAATRTSGTLVPEMLWMGESPDFIVNDDVFYGDDVYRIDGISRVPDSPSATIPYYIHLILPDRIYANDDPPEYIEFQMSVYCVDPPPQPFDQPIEKGSGGPINCGDIVAGSLSDSPPSHLWTLNATAGQNVIVAMDRTSGNLNAHVRILDANGNVIDGDDDSGGDQNALLMTTLPADGTYTIQAGRNALSGSNAGDYVMALTCPPPMDAVAVNPPIDQPPALPDQPDVIAPPSLDQAVLRCNTPVTGTLDANTPVNTWYYDAAGSAPFDVLMTATSGDLDAYLTITAPDGTVITDDDSGGGLNGLDALVTIYTSMPGRYQIEASAFNGSGTYQLTLGCAAASAPPPADQPTPQPSVSALVDTGPVSCGVPITSTIDANANYDMWYIDVADGQALDIVMQATSGNIDPYLVVTTPDGFIFEDDDSAGGAAGLDAMLSFSPTVIGRYQIEATILSGSGSYQLTVNCQAASDLPQIIPTDDLPSLPTAQVVPDVVDPAFGGGLGPVVFPGPGYPSWVVDQGVIGCNQTMSWSINNPAYYWEWTFQGTQGKQVEIVMQHTSGNLDPYLVVLVPNGTWYEDDDNGGNMDAQISFTLPVNGNYTIQTTRFDRDLGTTSGDFNLTVRCLN